MKLHERGSNAFLECAFMRYVVNLRKKLKGDGIKIGFQ